VAKRIGDVECAFFGQKTVEDLMFSRGVQAEGEKRVAKSMAMFGGGSLVPRTAEAASCTTIAVSFDLTQQTAPMAIVARLNTICAAKKQVVWVTPRTGEEKGFAAAVLLH
jgi:hypothetical protein